MALSTRIAVAAFLACLLPALNATEGVAATTTGPVVRVIGCGGDYTVRPPRIIVACATGNYQLVDLKWKTWGPYTATANGTASWNKCAPNCAESDQWEDDPAQVELSDVVGTSKGPRFTVISYRLEVWPETQRCLSTGCQIEWYAWQTI